MMETLYQILGLIAAGLIVWLLYRSIKGRPDQFSRENLSKSFTTMGFLGLILIGFIAFLVFMLRHS
ncbi:hypothetical protein Lmac_3001 [Legionella maceachernii]|uniref:Transmembrane protein n=2 Tax=Legionellaceae TaxID=444 RepID=A0A0W0VV59_9GAMM|nr:hypothetical protein [Legionella maceachernii]KTD24128.1 hypothetical protein Lmac_3001 [Legionella maceachernii]SJZ86832.1 hypothetical protein SAMN02745128_01297 [Legionella maceachernii]SUO99006.1 Uncharacterised protein [Legionella maceachernii]